MLAAVFGTIGLRFAIMSVIIVSTLTLLIGVDGLAKCTGWHISMKGLSVKNELEWTAIGSMKFEEGDMVVMEDGTLYIAVGEEALYTTMHCRGEFRVLQIRVSKRWLAYPEKLAAKFTPNYPVGWSADKAVALIKRLTNKTFPHSKWRCNGKHYMRYIIYAETRASTWRSCPLRRNLKDVSIEDIQSDDFYLMNGYKLNPKVCVNDLPDFGSFLSKRSSKVSSFASSSGSSSRSASLSPSNV